MVLPNTGNGKVDLIKKQIGAAIKKVKESNAADDHPELVEVTVLSIQIGEMVFDETVSLKDIIHNKIEDLSATANLQNTQLKKTILAEISTLKIALTEVTDQRKFNHKLWRLVGGIFGVGGLLGTLFVAIQLISHFTK